jgi:tetratricopeptide (TPR) repeat protein
VWVLLSTLLLVGCAGAPSAPLSPLKRQALEAETQGARRFEQGRLEVAVAHFKEAQRLSRSLDDEAGVARNLEHQARSELAAGLPQAAQITLATVSIAQRSISTGLLQAQAALAVQDTAAANITLQDLQVRCQTCAQSAAIAVLQARLALAQSQADVAEKLLQPTLKPLADQQEPRELANAWRLLAQAQALQQRHTEALTSVQQALSLDRALGLPERIAADWLLIAQVHLARNNPSDAAQARVAYARARTVAQAADLQAMVAQIDQSLKEMP